MNTESIGDKSNFAVEYYIENKDKLIGRARLWIQGEFLGSLNDTIFIDGYLVGGLVDILNKNSLDLRFLVEKKPEIYNLLDENRESGDDELYNLACSYIVNLGTWSDFFDVYSYRVSDVKGVIMWKLTGSNDELKDLINYPRDIFVKEFFYKDLRYLIEKISAI